MYQVFLSGQARKDLKRLDRRFQEKVDYALRLLGSNPFFGEKMSGVFQGSFRIKIPPIRIIYTPDHKSRIITVKAIGHRQGIYN